jgi:hypothetical protein
MRRLRSPFMTDDPSRGTPGEAGLSTGPAERPPRSGAFGPSPLRGLLCAIAAALVGGAAWYWIVVATDRQVSFMAVLLGLCIGHALTWGAGRGGLAPAAAAVVIATAAVIGTYYYIDRHLIIVGGEALGLSYSIPLIPTPRELATVVRLGFRVEGLQRVFAVLCLGAAGYFGFGSSAAPISLADSRNLLAEAPADTAQVSAPDGTGGG